MFQPTGVWGFAIGEFRRENFALKKGGEVFPWRNFGGTVPYFATAAGIVTKKSQARLRTRLSQPFLAQMQESGAADPVSGACKPKRWQPRTLCDAHAALQTEAEAKADLEATMGGFLLFAARSASSRVALEEWARKRSKAAIVACKSASTSASVSVCHGTSASHTDSDSDSDSNSDSQRASGSGSGSGSDSDTANHSTTHSAPPATTNIPKNKPDAPFLLQQRQLPVLL